MLKKSKSLMTITSKILSTDDWMQRLWDWADDNYIPDYCRYMVDGEEGYWGGLPRNKEVLVKFTDFSHNSFNEIFENLERSGTFKDKLEIPKEIENLVNLTEIYLTGPGLVVLPKEIGNLTNLKFLTLDNLFEIPKEIENLINLTSLTIENFNYSNKTKLVIPSEIGKLLNLESLTINHEEGIELILPKEIGNLSSLISLDLTASKLNLPEDITNLRKLKRLNLNVNTDFYFSLNQKAWISELIKNGCDVIMDDSLYREIELARRCKYLDEFNVDREVPITGELLDNDIPPRISAKLADGTFTFEEYLDEVSEYLDKEKFNNLVQKIYDTDSKLGSCFERNITFDGYANNKVTWQSIAEGEDRQLLITRWGVINMFVKEIFGFETKIVNISRRR